jgi:hypothetical protein
VALNLGGRRVAAPRDWRWRTFPVFFTFSATLFLTALVVELGRNTAVGPLVLILGAIPLSAALAHLVVARFIAPRIRPRNQ